MSYSQHQRHATQAQPRVRFAILTTSDSRTLQTDDAGRWLEDRLKQEHDIVARALVGDEMGAIRAAVAGFMDADVIIVTGGSGIAPTDVTPESFHGLRAKEIPGFGERFRARSESQVGSGAWLSRAEAFTLKQGPHEQLVFLLPGSPEAVQLATDELILPEIRHAVSLLRGSKPHA